MQVIAAVVLVVGSLAAAANFWYQLRKLRKVVQYLENELNRVRVSYDKWAYADPENESLLSGSDLVDAKPPAFQMVMRTTRSPFTQEWMTVGQAFLAQVKNHHGKRVPFVFTAWHCVEAASDWVKLTGPAGSVEMSPLNFRQVPGQDVAYYKPDLKQLTRLGVSAARVDPLMTGTPVVVAGLGKMSHGKLSHATNIGLVDYDGSTCKGFSGAPYYCGKVVFGIHTASSTQKKINFGVSMDFVTMLVRKIEFGIQEDSDEYYYHEIMEQHKRGTLQWAYSNPNDRDTVNFRDTRGRYHQMDAEDFDNFVTKNKIPSRNYFREGGDLQSALMVASSASQTDFLSYDVRVDCDSSTFEGTTLESLDVFWDAEGEPQCQPDVVKEARVPVYIPLKFTTVSTQTVPKEGGSSIAIQTDSPRMIDFSHGPERKPKGTRDVATDMSAPGPLVPMYPQPNEELESAILPQAFLEERLKQTRDAPVLASTSARFQPDAELVSFLRQLVLDMKKESELTSVMPGLQQTPVQRSEASENNLTDQIQRLQNQVRELQNKVDPKPAKKKKPTTQEKIRAAVALAVEEERKKYAHLLPEAQPSGIVSEGTC